MQERLQKIIANAGITSRRKAEVLITEGKVSVNGKTVKTLGTKADASTDHIKVNGKLINPKLEKKSDTYILLNKPKGILCTVSDPDGRKTIMDLVRGYGRIFPVGRLDYNSEGLLILTNDGDFANRVASSRKVPKIYRVKVKGQPKQNAINRLRRGLRLHDGFKTAPAEIKELQSTKKNAWFEVTLLEGHNRQVRKMFDAVGFSVVKLKRVGIGKLSEAGLQPGEHRELSKEEVKSLIS
ncbi:MAG: rRNA pseudouridine synthase [Pyrinomonadaceae bacterium]|nr:rRNA pseudouridine synthase [Pyrinomonadaceae bacterium]